MPRQPQAASRRVWSGLAAAPLLLIHAAAAQSPPAAAEAADAPEPQDLAQAQNTDSAAPPQEGDTRKSMVLEEVVVTARRREESLQNVPSAVTAFSGVQLQRSGAEDIVALGQAVPNVTLEVSRSTNTTLTPFIRGVGQQDPVAGFEQGVGVYIDDVYLNRPQGAVLQVYEVDRIEVLRGPQGTLYGRNTIGGAVKYVTRRIGVEPQTRVTLRTGSYGQADAIVSSDLPLTEDFRFGATLASLQRDGFGDNLTIGGRENYNKDILAARAAFEWTPLDSLLVRLSGDVSDDESDPRQGHRLTVGNQSGAPVLDDVFDTRAGLDGRNEVEASGAALAVDWTINERYTFKSITAYRADDSIFQEDFDSLAVPDFDVPFIVDNQQTSQELQLHYAGDRLKGVAGAFYMDADAFNKFDVILGQTIIEPAFPEGITAFTLGDFQTDTWSLFADFSWQLIDTVEVSLGGRYTSDERSARILRQTYSGQGSPAMGLGGDATLLATSTDFAGSDKFSKFTPRAGVKWQPAPDYNVYATYSQGFKGGSFDPRGDATQTPDTNGNDQRDYEEIKAFLLFEPETVDSFEIGAKTRHFDGRFASNVALFWSDYTDIQVPGSVGVDTDGDGVEDSFRGVTTNAGKATLWGVEFEGQAFFTDALSASTAIGYINAEFDEFIVNNTDVSDQRVFQKTPEWTASVSLTYRVPLALYTRDGDIALNANASYRDDVNQFDTPIPLLDQDAFTLVNASVVWEAADGALTLGLHGRNLTGKEYKTAGFNFPNLGREGTVTAFYGDPRTFTASVGLRF